MGKIVGGKEKAVEARGSLENNVVAIESITNHD